jgi:hypothetical protein
MAIAAADPAPAEVITWARGSTTLPAAQTSEVLVQLAVPLDRDPGAEQRRQSRLAADLVMQRGLQERLQPLCSEAELHESLIMPNTCPNFRPPQRWRRSSRLTDGS